MTSSPPRTAEFGTCSFCGFTYYGRPNQCRRCGQLLHEAAEDARRLAAEGRRVIAAQKAVADTMFLAGLLLGGPIMTLGGMFRLGLFVMLAASIGSVLRRYSNWSTVGCAVVGSALSAVVAVVILEPPVPPEEAVAAAEARAAYAAALHDPEHDVYVETRGAGHVAIWFTVPQAQAGACSTFPPPEVRAHLAELGFRRVVVALPNRSGGICSFAPAR